MGRRMRHASIHNERRTEMHTYYHRNISCTVCFIAGWWLAVTTWENEPLIRWDLNDPCEALNKLHAALDARIDD